MKEYKNITPKQKYVLILISYTKDGGNLAIMPTMTEDEEMFDQIPVNKRMTVLCSMIIWKYTFGNGDNSVMDILTDCGWPSDSQKHIMGSYENLETERLKITNGINASLSFLKSKWPYDYAVAQKIIHSEESACFALSAKTESTTGSAFAPESSKGFYRNIEISYLPGMIPLSAQNIMEAMQKKDLVKAMELTINPESWENTTGEVDFPPTTKT